MKKNYLLAGALLSTIAFTVHLNVDLLIRTMKIKNNLKDTIFVYSKGFWTSTDPANAQLIKPGRTEKFFFRKRSGVKHQIYMTPKGEKVTVAYTGQSWKYWYVTPANSYIHQWRPLEGYKNLQVQAIPMGYGMKEVLKRFVFTKQKMVELIKKRVNLTP